MLISQIKIVLAKLDFNAGAYKRVDNIQYLDAVRKSDGLEVTVMLIDAEQIVVFSNSISAWDLRERIITGVAELGSEGSDESQVSEDALP